MPELPQPPYRVDRVPPVDKELRELGKEAVRRGLRAEFLAALRHIHGKLQTDPTGWGEPEHHTTLPGGLVCHGVYRPLSVRYAVYSVERSVLILHFSLLSGEPPESND